MGVAITNLLEPQEIVLEQLQGKTIAIDAMNMLYQFVSTIRQHDGTPLKDSKGNITSHLTGLFSRCSRLLQKNIKLVFVFDGKMPELKAAERARREKLKEEAAAAHAAAEESKDTVSMKKFASRTARITPVMLEESKALLDAMGIPHMVAPSEGEAQAAAMVRNGDCDFVASQDIDCLIYGAPKVIRNLSISQKRKKINALTYKSISPEMLTLKFTLKTLGLTLDQLRALAILVGTDFNIGGIKGLGPKKSLQKVKEFGEDFNALFASVDAQNQFDVPWQDIFKTVKEMPTTNDYSLSWETVDRNAVLDLLVEQHDFSRERVLHTLDEIEAARKRSLQTDLGSYFG